MHKSSSPSRPDGGRSRGHSFQTMVGQVGSRPPSHAPSHAPSEAFAFGIATEAMRNAADAMSRAAEAMNTRATINMLTFLPAHSSTSNLLHTSPEIPQRRSSLEPERLEGPKDAYLGTGVGSSYSQGSLKTPLQSLDRLHREKRLGGGSQTSHMDLMDAVHLHVPYSNEKSFTRYFARSYGEEVADRNIGGLYGPPSRTSSLPLAAGSTPPLNSFDPEQDLDGEYGYGHNMSLMREVVFIAIICQAQLLTQCALAQTIVPLPYIARTFGPTGNPSSLAWYSAGFVLTVGTFILPSGRLGDVYGHKLLFMIGWGWFCLSSLRCGFGPMIQSAGMDGSISFVVARELQGIDPAIAMPNGLALMGTSYAPGKKKNMLFALFRAAAPAGFVIGAIFSSLLAQKAGREWGFWVMSGVCALLMVLTIAFVQQPDGHGPPPSSGSSPAPRRGMMGKMRDTATFLDIPGAVLGVTALLVINIALNQAPLVDWTTPYIYFLLVIGLILMGLFFYQQTHALFPLLPSSLLNKATVFVLVCTACGWASMGIWIFYIWSYMERLHHLSPLLASAWFAPAPIAGCVASLVTGWGLSKGKPQWVMLASMVAFCLGTTLISTAEPGRSYWVGVFFSVVVMPFGMDMSFPSATLLVSDRAGRGSQGMAASVIVAVVFCGVVWWEGRERVGAGREKRREW